MNIVKPSDSSRACTEIQAMAHLQGVTISQNRLEKKKWNISHLILTTKTWSSRFSQQLMMRSEHSVGQFIPAGLGLGKFSLEVTVSPY